MADVFISYSSKHRGLTEKLAALLAKEGYSVWWDHDLESWGSYEAQIRAALESARIVVVIWNEAAATSDWVYSEARKADTAGKLVNALPPGLPVSLVRQPFDAKHIDTLDLGEPHRLLRSIRGVWTGKPHATAKPLHEHYLEGFGVNLFDPNGPHSIAMRVTWAPPSCCRRGTKPCPTLTRPDLPRRCWLGVGMEHALLLAG